MRSRLLSSLLLANALCATACAPLRSTDRELRSQGPNDGVAYGSILLATEKSEGDSSWEFLQGQKSAGSTYSLSISNTSLNPFTTKYVVRLTPDEVMFFVKKLPEGEYKVSGVSKEGFTNLELDLRPYVFRVTPGKVTYVGRFTMLFPNRIRAGSPVQVTIGDYMAETTETLAPDYDEGFFANAEKGLMTGD